MSVYNVRKLHRPRMSDALLADGVDTTLASLYTRWPNKNRTFFEIPYFCSYYRYNHAVFAEVLRNYRRKQQATIFLNDC